MDIYEDMVLVSVRNTTKHREKFDATTEEWLESQEKTTQILYAYRWKFFHEFTGKTGAEILASRKQDKDYYWEKQVLAFKKWMLEKKKASPSLAKAATVAARSFFSYYRSPLVFRTQEKTTLRKAARVTEDYKFTLEDLDKMAMAGDLTEKYIVTAGKSFGLRAGDFIRITRGQLEPYIDREPPISIGELETEKESVKAFPFVDTDAKPIIKLMLAKMTKEGRTKPNDRILRFKDEIQLSRVLQRLVRETDINVGNKRVRFHLLRKFLTDRLSSVMSESKWKQVVGNQIAEGAYISADSLREDYKRAMPQTCFPKSVDTNELVKAEIRTRLEGLSPEQRKAFAAEIATQYRQRATAIFSDERIKKLLAEAEGKPDGGSVQIKENFEQIPENELLQRLKDGWQIVKELSNGEVIVKR